LSRLRAIWRLGWGLSHALHGALICAVVFPFMSPAQRMQRVGWWSARMLKLLGVRWHVSGTAQPGPVLFVANHISWLDILAINAVRPVRFVSKSDVRHWPFLGYLVASGGTLFIERERKRDALRVVHQVADALKAGETVAVFPEGTTTDGHALLPFHANLLQAAIATESPVQPIALRFSDSGHAVSLAVTFIGETTLMESFWWVLCADGLQASVHMLPPQATQHLERRVLAALVRSQIADALGLPSGVDSPA
jgi:1-acyl-sn-glycerol-3-phosphate acyltransferase